MKIIVGTKNATKIEAVCNVVDALFNGEAIVEGVRAPSGVSDMPLSDEEAITGAKNRALHCLEKHHCDLAVGIEGSVRDTTYGLFMTCWVVVKSPLNESLGAGAQIRLPDSVRTSVLQGKALGKLFTLLPPQYNYSPHLGPMGFLTKGVFSRRDAIETAVKMAMGPIVRKEIYGLESWPDDPDAQK